MNGIAIFSTVIGIIWFIVKHINKQPDPFRYTWGLNVLNKRYWEEKNKGSFKEGILKDHYYDAVTRIRNGSALAERYLPAILEEAEHVQGRKQSLEQLKKTTWIYLNRLAKLAGYNESEIGKDAFFCPGWNQIWDIYHKNKKRILEKEKAHFSKKRENPPPPPQDNSSHQFHESIKEKNKSLFEGILDIKELKKKYHSLAKLNHPDHGGNHKAMQLLNEYYDEALNKIREREPSYH